MAARSSASSVEEEPTSRGGSGAYTEYLAEREEVLRHKWVMSEEAGKDVGFEAALVDWVEHYRSTWRKMRAKQA